MFVTSVILTQAMAAASMGPTAFPVFLKEGFSSILEFEEAPSQVVLGDQNLFQVERLNRSIVIKPLSPYATTNMFVYFKAKETKLFLLVASEESEPTYYKKFSSVLPPVIAPKKSPTTKIMSQEKNVKEVQLHGMELDKKKDYLTVDFTISSDSSGKIAPSWELVRLKSKDRTIAPLKLWSERREVQRDTRIRARAIFQKPNVSSDLKETSLIVPVKGSTKAMTLNLERSTK